MPLALCRSTDSEDPYSATVVTVTVVEPFLFVVVVVTVTVPGCDEIFSSCAASRTTSPSAADSARSSSDACFSLLEPSDGGEDEVRLR